MKAHLYRFLVILTLISASLGFTGCGSTDFQKLIPPISATELEASVDGRFTSTKVAVVEQVATGTEVTAKELTVEHKNPWITFKLHAKNWVRKIVGAAPPPSAPTPQPRRPGKRKGRRKESPAAPTPNRAGALPRRGTHPWRGEPVITTDTHGPARS